MLNLVEAKNNDRMISVLIIGGSRFVGRLVAQQLHQHPNIKLTLFNRGLTNPEIIEGINYIYGDRECDDIRQVYTQSWDVVIDMMGYYPDTIKDFISKINTKRYIFISSISVYDLFNPSKTIIGEQDTLLSECTVKERTDTTWATYGNRKVSCETEILKSGMAAIILRPSLIYGPFDPTDRLYYWWYRIKNKVPYLMPKSLIYPVTFTYAVDMASIIVQSVFIEKHRCIYNTVTHDVMPFYHFMDLAAGILKADNKVQIIDDALLIDKKLTEDDMPLWFKDECMVFKNQRLIEDFNLSFTPLKKSVEDSLSWYDKRDWQQPSAGMRIDTENIYLKELSK